MTDPARPTDEELAQRIRRSMSHYQFERPLQIPAQRETRRRWDVARLVIASAAGAAMAIVVLGLLRGFAPAPVGEGPPTPQPSRSIDASPVPSTAAPADPPTAEEAAVECLALDAGEVADDWVQEGEDAMAVLERFAGLPLVMRDDRATGSVLVFADERFVVMCEWSSSASTPEGIARAVREPTSDPSVKVLFAFSERDGAEPAPPDFMGDQVSVGVVRDDVAEVLVILADGSRVEAMVAGGLWMAWWHEPIDAESLRGYDASGRLLDESPADPTSP